MLYWEVNNQTLYLLDSKPKQEGEKCGFSFECDEGLECKVVNKASKFGFPTQKCVKKEGNNIIISEFIGSAFLQL